jgi:acetyl esterase/lipase
VVAFYPPVDIHALYQYGTRLYDDRYPGKNALVAMLKGMGLMRPDDVFIAPPNLMTCLLGDTPENLPERYAQASPLSYVGDHCPPTLLLHGQHDSLVGVEHSRVLRNALQANGVDVALVEYPMTDHGFDLSLPEVSPAAQAAFYDLERFLALME